MAPFGIYSVVELADGVTRFAYLDGAIGGVFQSQTAPAVEGDPIATISEANICCHIHAVIRSELDVSSTVCHAGEIYTTTGDIPLYG